MRTVEGPLERAMTHWTEDRACQRPKEVRAIANRLHNWRTERETCKSCVAAPAIIYRAGESLCGRCRDQRDWAVGMLPLVPQSLAVRAEPMAGAMKLAGYAIVTGVKSLNLGGFVEIIQPEALSRTFKERIDVRALWNHNHDLVLGRLSATTLTIAQDARGLSMNLTLPKAAEDKFETVQRRDVTGQSFGFHVVDDEWSMDGEMPLRYVLDMRVNEVSVVSWPAYPQTSVDAVPAGRSVDMLRRQLRTEMAR